MTVSLSPIERILLKLVINLYPRRFRRRFGPSIEETFYDRILATATQAERNRFLIRFLIDGCGNAVRERIRPADRKSTPIRNSQTMTRRFQHWLQDLRFAVRTLRRRPGFTIAAVGTLALGFGGNTAIFSVVNGVLLRPLPYVEAERLVRIDVAPEVPDGNTGSMSYPDIADILAQAPSLETLVGLNASRQTLTGMGDARIFTVNRLTDGLFDTFQTTPLLGRDIRADEFGVFTVPPRVLVINHRFWQNELGADPDVVGRTVTLDGESWEIVGVAPPGFDFPGDIDAWRPRFLDVEDCGRGCHTMRTIGRLADGATLQTLQAELDQLAVRLETAYPESNTNKRFVAESLHDYVVGDVRQGLIILMGSVVLVLLIACANVANLLLASAATREREIAIRVALGAGRARLMSLVFAESLVIAAAGAGVGLAIAGVSLSAFRTLSEGTIPRVEEVTIDGTILLWTLGSALVVTVLFGLIPAFSGSHATPADAAIHSGRGGTANRTVRFRTALLVAEVGLSTTLLIGAGLLLRTFTELYRTDLGYETENIVRFRLALPSASYGDLERVRGFYRTLETEIAATPGVAAVASVWGPPLGAGNASGTVLVEGRPEPEPADETEASIHPVSPRYFETMRIPIVQGRALEPQDDTSDDLVAVVNAAFVRENLAGEDPVGKRVRVTVNMGYGSPTWRIVGVTPDIRSRTLEATSAAMIYVPHGLYGPSSMHVVVRTDPRAPPVIDQIRAIVRSLDPNLPLYSVETLDDAIRQQLAPTRLYLSLVAAFAIVAALLASVGLYGVVSYVVSSRTREIGVRIALGADRRRVQREIVHRGMRPVVAGLALGVLLAIGSGRVVESVLYGVEPLDPATFASAALLLTVVSLAAIAIPAFRASRLSPARTLREEA